VCGRALYTNGRLCVRIIKIYYYGGEAKEERSRADGMALFLHLVGLRLLCVLAVCADFYLNNICIFAGGCG
jgi:hypothetical protein